MIQSLKNSVRLLYLMLILIVEGCKNTSSNSTLPYFNKPDFTPEWIANDNPAYRKIHTIPAFSFMDQDSNRVTEKSVEGKIYVANFFFTRCVSICPKMTNNMKVLQKKFIDDSMVLFLSHSVTPDLDSVPVLNRYAKANEVIGSKWHLLTGKQDEIYRLARKEYFAGEEIGYYQKGNEFLHTENFILIDQHRRVRGIYNGTLSLEMERLSEDIQLLKSEK